MFGYNPEVSDLKTKVADKDEQIKDLKNELEKEERAHKHSREDYELALSRKTESIDTAVQKATKELNAKIQELTIAKNNAEKEAAILNKAFENLGFDVKDMKDILNKLVDGIVSKNQIQLINTGNK